MWNKISIQIISCSFDEKAITADKKIYLKEKYENKI